MSDDLSGTTTGSKKDRDKATKLDTVVDPLDTPAEPAHDPVKPVTIRPVADKPDPGPSALEDRLSSVEDLLQKLVNFFHWMFPGHNAPGVPGDQPAHRNRRSTDVKE